MPTNLAKRPDSQSYYARIAVPIEFQNTIGKKEVWRSLRTNDFKQAKQRLPKALADIQQSWRAAKNRSVNLVVENEIDEHEAGELTDELQALIVGMVYENDLTADMEQRNRAPSFKDLIQASGGSLSTSSSLDDLAGQLASGECADLEGVLFERANVSNPVHRDARRTLLRLSLSANDASLVHAQIDKFLKVLNIELDQDAERYKVLANHVVRAKLAALQKMDERDEGLWNAQPSDPVVNVFREQFTPRHKQSLALADSTPTNFLDAMSFYETYADDNPRGVSADTLHEGRKSVAMLLEFKGAADVENIFDRQTLRDWRNLLRNLPLRANEKSCFKGMTIAEIVEANRSLGQPVVTARVVNKHLNHVSAFCNWLVDEGHLTSNPMNGLRIHEKFDPENRLPFTTTQLNQIFASPLFHRCKSRSKSHLIGEVMIRDHWYWLPLLALFTGARLGELAQLLVSDVEKFGDRWIIHITEKGGCGKVIKNKSSERMIPVHRRLIDLGLLNHIKSLNRKTSTQLFPEVTRNSRGQIAATFSRSWGKHLENIGVKSDASVNFHSFRHTVADELRRAGFADDQIGTLLGHSKQGMTSRYGVLNEGTVEQRAKMVDALEYKGLALP